MNRFRVILAVDRIDGKRTTGPFRCRTIANLRVALQPSSKESPVDHPQTPASTRGWNRTFAGASTRTGLYERAVYFIDRRRIHHAKDCRCRCRQCPTKGRQKEFFLSALQERAGARPLELSECPDLSLHRLEPDSRVGARGGLVSLRVSRQAGQEGFPSWPVVSVPNLGFAQTFVGLPGPQRYATRGSKEVA